MIGKGPVPEWLETDWLLGHFGKQRKRAIERYIEFVRAGKGLNSVWDDKKHPGILGDEDFIETIYKNYVDSVTAELKEFIRIERRMIPVSKPFTLSPNALAYFYSACPC